ncbi:MAG: 16S rRNA (uracil(1498)-N(3))-methyltransferase [Magnetococcus sp. DMHC-6]
MLIRLAAVPDTQEQMVRLAPEAQQALSLWQARVGEIVTVCDPNHKYYRGRLLADFSSVQVFATLPDTLEPPYRCRICQAIPNRERMIWIIQKGVELGASEIQPIITERSYGMTQEKKIGPRQDKFTTWNKVAAQAARQCRRALLPIVHPPVLLETILQHFSPTEEGWFLDWPGDPTKKMGAWRCDRTLFVGPEGGWSDRERELFQQVKINPITFGSRLLRTETAALVAMVFCMDSDVSFTVA